VGWQQMCAQPNGRRGSSPCIPNEDAMNKVHRAMSGSPAFLRALRGLRGESLFTTSALRMGRRPPPEDQATVHFSFCTFPFALFILHSGSEQSTHRYHEPSSTSRRYAPAGPAAYGGCNGSSVWGAGANETLDINGFSCNCSGISVDRIR
jgi:hypothetical protein